MTAPDAVPVVLFLFNRASMLDQVVDVLCRARPRLVLAIADGPRPDHADDVARCAAARAVVDRLDESCRVIRHFSQTNLGCNERIRSGLDWAFEQVSEAIVLEDDVVPDLSFFPWCARMLDRYRDVPNVMHVSGRNHLGRWTQQGEGHCLLHRASSWGWATWRRAWQRPVAMPGTQKDIVRAGERASIDRIVLDHLMMLHEIVSAGKSSATDWYWDVKKALVGGLSVVPSVNVIKNIGFGADSTRTKFAGDIGTFTPVWSAPAGAEADRCLEDHKLDLWLTLFELMAAYRAPDMARRLARSVHSADAAGQPADRRLHHHLAPFRVPQESLAALEHFHAAGAPAEPLRDLMNAMRIASAAQGRPTAA